MLSLFARHLYSTAGHSGLVDLLDRAQIWFEPLSDAWRSRSDEKGISRLVDVLADAIRALDRFDLRPREVRLRPIVGGLTPIGMVCKLTRAMVEHLANGDERAVENVLDALAAAGSLDFEFDLGFRAALAEFLIEKGAYDRAVAVIDKNLVIKLCPYSEHLLYRALSGKKQAGEIRDSPRIGLDDLSDRFCEQPFEAIATLPPSSFGASGATPALFACSCAGMLPYPLGQSRSGRDATVEDYWNGPEIQEIRRSILEGDFTYCSRMLCPRTLNNSLQKRDDVTDPAMRDIIDNKRTRISTAPRLIMLAHDESCNLACPSCRPRILTIRNDARERLDDFVEQIILPLMEDADVEVHLAGDGDPFGSKHYRKLLHSLDPMRHRGVKLSIHSNGLLCTPKEWESLYNVEHLIKGVAISIDAAQAATYEDVRRPGKWATLTENMEFLANLRREGKIGFLYICFVVQKKNFEQMPAFVELGREWSVDRVFFYKLFQTIHPDSSSSAEFEANAVTESSHPDHQRFLEVLQHPILRSNEVYLHNVAPYLDQISTRCAMPAVDVDAAAPDLDVQTPDLVQAPRRKRSFLASVFLPS